MFMLSVNMLVEVYIHIYDQILTDQHMTVLPMFSFLPWGKEILVKIMSFFKGFFFHKFILLGVPFDVIRHMQSCQYALSRVVY